MTEQYADSTLAPTPPMGWNSWDCFGSVITEAETKANADYMAKHLLPYGWQYLVVDIQWYEPEPRIYVDGHHPGGLTTEEQYASAASGGRPELTVEMDEFGRLFPCIKRFPSSADWEGFKPLADYVHSLGLKFGIHVMRGVPRKAVRDKCPIEGTTYTCDQIADRVNTCNWNVDNFGIDMTKPGAQEYYDSLMRLYASWDVDFIKCDDMLCSPYHEEEITAWAKAAHNHAPHIVLSLSPGIEGVHHVEHLRRCVHMWRASCDFWDHWEEPKRGFAGLKAQFEICAAWAPHIKQGHWPDADMLPLGKIGKNDSRDPERMTRFTKPEQYTLVSLQTMCRSPLMFGGDMTQMDDFTLSLLTNPDVIEVNQHSKNNRQVLRTDDAIVWAAESEDGLTQYLALFNIGDEEGPVIAPLSDIGLTGKYDARELWTGNHMSGISGELSTTIAPHGAAIFALTKP